MITFFQSAKRYLLATLFLLSPFFAPLFAQDVEAAALAVERLLDQNGTTDIYQFVDKFMTTGADSATVRKIRALQADLKGLRDGIGLDLDDDGAILSLFANGVEKRLRILYDFSQDVVTDLFIMAPEEKLVFDPDHPEEILGFLKEQDMAGVIFIRQNGKIILEAPFGMANRALNQPNGLETIFAIGSRPIDFTTAAILLLDQRSQLSLDDPIDQHLDQVPADKKTMTLRHLMSGTSGLPDFFDLEQDWDPDLQWVDREEAVRRMMAQKLRFPPGEGRAHSHGAFGLLAAIIELTTGKTYLEFLQENFFTPAEMQRTGEYGDQQTFTITDFAEGGGPQLVGLPNIPPNWGPTSWLIKGSGGMYSTLGDLRKFYALIRNGDIFDEEHQRYFQGTSVNVDGSMRGFELFSTYYPPHGEVFLFLNAPGDRNVRRKIFRALEQLMN
ncbi:serine hydrolase [Lewinella sp. W8]|uniref:serine hydrolase domain-containing protein n=1 Tax=Lewinella sp. W8 TaxID=2528208 RepID=UPI00106754A3|nr:serine hydrolase domain-containing protein [Lewinella sp. W8]MTB52988.1 serine hydrolase [Lewinella sp. W8]